MLTEDKKLGTLLLKLCILSAVLLAMTALTRQSFAESPAGQLSVIRIGTPVPVGELEAVGTIPGCTATLISNSRVLTAAHCVCPDDWDKDFTKCAKRSTLTLYNVFPIDDPNTSVEESQTRRNVNIEGNVRVHPEYELHGWAQGDYAVIDLDQPITAVARVTPIPVEEPQNIPIAGDYLTLVGYGDTGVDCLGQGQVKMKMDAFVYESSWRRILFVPPVSCPGDSGGPIINSAKHVVGVASWIGNDSTYRSTSYAYNWIYGIPQPAWSSCQWYPIERAGKNSHQPTQLCPDGSFLTDLSLSGDRSLSAQDAPVIQEARCCKVAGAENVKWDSSLWVKVEQAGINSHSPFGNWCPQGHFITGIDLDRCATCDASDSPVIGQVQCSRLAGPDHALWGSSYWMNTPFKAKVPQWCLDGAFITQLDLDRAPGTDAHDSPVIGGAKCSAMSGGIPKETPVVKLDPGFPFPWGPLIESLFAPGVYVTDIRLDPPDPKTKQDVWFNVKFLNTTGMEQRLDWFTNIYNPDQKNPFGNTSYSPRGDGQDIIPVGESERRTLNAWHLTMGGECQDFWVKANWFNPDSGDKPEFTGPDGQEFLKRFQVCP